MKMIKLILSNYFLLFLLIKEIDAQTVKCDYKKSYDDRYECNLNTAQANYDEKVTKIDGRNGIGHSDFDVKRIAKYKGNKLKTFSSIFCQKFPNLEVIKINNAELEFIDGDSLSNCKNLNELLLDGNKFRELPANSLIQNSKLTSLRIHKNQLTTLPENLFMNQKELEELQLHDNQINYLPGKTFHPLVKLESLYLDNNKLQSMNPEWFTTLQSLKELGLNGNQITEIPSKCFSSLRSLERLWLYENKIKTLNSDNFDGLQNLRILNLRNNEMSDLPVGVFTQLKNLQELYLHRNKLTTIHSDSFSIHNQLTKVWLQDNKINEIDEKFIDNTAISILNMTNNICSQLSTETKSEIKPNLKKCFDNYQPRTKPQPQVTQPIFPFRNQFTTTNQNICGKSSTGQGNIIGGQKTHRGEFPWMAALITPKGKFFCGGTLISNRKVITAAHCIQEKKTYDALLSRDMLVLLGAYDLDNTYEPERAVKPLQSINMHPDWNPFAESFDADIAVLVLESEVTFGSNIQPICINLNSNIKEITKGLVVGYGKSEDESKVHENIPKILEMPIHDNVDCFLKNHLLATLSSRRTFCAGTGTGIGVCNGDSGGGLIVTYGSAYYLRGVVSSSLIGGQYGCDVNSYSVFTDISVYIDWINGIPTSRFKRSN